VCPDSDCSPESVDPICVITVTLTGNQQISGGTDPQKFGETCNDLCVSMCERMMNTRQIYEQVILNQEFLNKLGKQKDPTRLKESNINSKCLVTSQNILSCEYCSRDSRLCKSRVT
jgi:hypothetical protein